MLIFVIGYNNMPKKGFFDALIIGAGPAGATAAYILAADGYKVGIIEKKPFPRDKLCGGLLSQKTIRLLKDIFNLRLSDLKARGVIQYQSSSYSVGDRSGKCLYGKLDFPFHFVNRKMYDAFWVDQAVSAGAEAIFREKAQAVDTASGKVVTRLGRQFEGRFIIAADGVFSRVRTLLFQRGLIKCRGMHDIAPALEIFLPRDERSEFPHYPKIYYGYIPWGYAWSFPGTKAQILGICGLKQKGRHSITKCFRDFLSAQQIPESDFSNAKGYALPYGNYLHKAGYNNILLVGDAGGFADPLLGEGIYYAHKSAQLAAAAVRQSFDRPGKVLADYSALLCRSVLTELKYAKMIRQVLFSLPGQWQFNVLSFMLKQIPNKWVEAVQGQRSFKLLRPKTRIRSQRSLFGPDVCAPSDLFDFAFF
jgi:geranylgeranyl reductase family protein